MLDADPAVTSGADKDDVMASGRSAPGATAPGASSDPRAVITGVTPHKSDIPWGRLDAHYESAAGGHSEFDWYQATLPRHHVDDVLPVLCDGLGLDIRPGTPRYGYTLGFELVGPDGVAVRALAGGPNGGPNLSASGGYASGLAALLRSVWPADHRVSRFDSRIDLGAVDGDPETIWSALFDLCVQRAGEQGLTTHLVGDYVGKEKGRTLYIGAPSSPVRVRLYEKGKQLRSQSRAGASGSDARADWCRLEVQVRPVKDRRWDAARITADEGWGFSPWTQALVSEVVGLDTERLSMRHKRETNDERAFAWLAQQYAGTLLRMAGQDGWTAVLGRLRSEVERLGSGSDAGHLADELAQAAPLSSEPLLPHWAV